MSDNTTAPVIDSDGWAASKVFGWGYFLLGLVGLVMSFVISVEKIRLLEDPNFTPTCSINSWISCGSVMESPQANAFGFPNPLIGLIGYPVVMTLGLMLVQGKRLPKWMWWSFLLGLTAAIVFVHWLAYSAIYDIVALCPYCMVVWAATFPLWMMTLVHILHQRRRVGSDSGDDPTEGYSNAMPVAIVLVWYLAIAVLIWEQFIL